MIWIRSPRVKQSVEPVRMAAAGDRALSWAVRSYGIVRSVGIDVS